MPHSQLASLLPHQGTALWLTRITQHSPQRISGTCDSQCLAELSAAHSAYLFEAVAQLCAAHGALYAKQNTASEAYIGKLSQLKVYHAHPAPNTLIHITAQQRSANEASALYQFSIQQQQQLLLDGTVLLVLNHA